MKNVNPGLRFSLKVICCFVGLVLCDECYSKDEMKIGLRCHELEINMNLISTLESRSSNQASLTDEIPLRFVSW